MPSPSDAPVGTSNRVVADNGRILRQDSISQPRPSMIVERRLDKYVEDYRTRRGVSEPSATIQPSEPPAIDPSIAQPATNQDAVNPRASEVVMPISQPEEHFVARADFDNAFAANHWGTPVIQQSIPLSDSLLVQPESSPTQSQATPTEPVKFQRIDSAHPTSQQLAGRAKLNYPIEQNVEPNVDQVARELERYSELGSIAEQTARNKEQQILVDPETREIVAAVSSAIASVIKDQPVDQILPEAKNLFESNLKQHAMVLEQQSAASQGDESGISDAMISSIVQQRQQQADVAPIAATVSPTTLASQLRDRIATHQRSIIGSPAHPTQEKNAEDSAAVETAEMPVAEMPVAEMPVAEMPVAEMDDRQTRPCKNQSTPIVTFKPTVGNSVPMEAAAWDVEDFRWPAITNQMIVSGGPAIEQLLAIATSRAAAGPKRVAVSSAGRSQGATTIAITMARIAVAAGMKTLLVDADVASPSLSQRVGLSANMSWLNGVNKDLPVAELIVRSKTSNLCMMPLSSTVTRVTWPRFIFDNLGELVSPGLQHFDLVLIDAGPVSQLLDELSSPANLLDAVVLVDSTAKPKEVQVYQNRLTTFGVDNLVLAENRKSAAASQVA